MDILNTGQFSEICLIKGEGCWVWDRDGNRYLDLLAGTWSNVLGHCHPIFTSKIQSQLEKLVHVGSREITREVRAAGERLAEVLPGELNRVTFLSTGSEAVELAIKIARIATGRQDVVSFRQGYYGATNQTLALSEVGRDKPYLAPFQPNHHLRIPAPDCSHCAFDTHPSQCAFRCLNSWVTETENRVSGQTAAILFEPIIGSQIIVPPSGYVTRLAEVAARWDSLIIAEEVTTGLGRTGEWFGFQHDGIIPDILVLGKALGNGLPVAAVITTSEVEADCAGRLKHVQSHQNDPLSGAAATAVIDVIKEEKLIERVEQMGVYLIEGLKRLQKIHTGIEEVRGAGLMVALELNNGEKYTERGSQIQRVLRESGILVDYRPEMACFRFFPPYVITQEQIDFVLEALNNSFRVTERLK